ncbi:MAG: beta-phosphoglucomutase family hydrolase [Acidimicrobiia bacterium]|nr:beta-phosphoglucomutase family hydrolase [Acidimicrobiia bacterium]
MEPGRPVAAVLFDLDGVLTDTSEAHYLAWQRLADEEGLSFDRAANEALRGLSRAESLAVLLAGHPVPAPQRADLMERKNRYYRESLEHRPPRLLPGAQAAVEAAARRGLRTAVVSSSRNTGHILALLGIAERFDHVSDGRAVPNAKPAPDLFLHAAAALRVPIGRCLVVEDAASGVAAALAAGARVVGIGPEERVGAAHQRFDSMAEFDLEAAVKPKL